MLFSMPDSNTSRFLDVSIDFDKEWRSVLLIILGCLTAIVSGLLVIVVVQLRHKSLLYLLILNHNLADLITSLFVILQVGLYVGNRQSIMSCSVMTFARWVALYEYFMALLLVSIERWIQASGYVQYSRIVTKRSVSVAIAVTWLLSGSCVTLITILTRTSTSRKSFISSINRVVICFTIDAKTDNVVTRIPPAHVILAPIMIIVLAITFTVFQTSAIRHLRYRYLKTKEAIEKGQTGYGIHPMDTAHIGNVKCSNRFVTVEEKGIKCLQNMLRTSKAMVIIIVVFDVLIIPSQVVYLMRIIGSPSWHNALEIIGGWFHLGMILNGFLSGIFYISFMSGIRCGILNLLQRRKNGVRPTRDISLSKSRVATIGS